MNLGTLVVSGGAAVTNDGLKSLVDRCTRLTVSYSIHSHAYKLTYRYIHIATSR